MDLSSNMNLAYHSSKWEWFLMHDIQTKMAHGSSFIILLIGTGPNCLFCKCFLHAFNS